MSAQPEFLSVKNYDRFQHYKHRNPVWIKLYNEVMDDAAFLGLSDAERGQLMLIWLLASRRDNKIPHDAKAIARAIQSSGRVDIAKLLALGFLVPWSSASNALAGCEQSDSEALAEYLPHPRPRARVEGETEKEKETDSSSSPEDDIRRLVNGLPEHSRPAWSAEIAARQQGMHGPLISVERIALAARQYVGDGHLAKPSLRHFGGYMDKQNTPQSPLSPSRIPLTIVDEVAAWKATTDANEAAHG